MTRFCMNCGAELINGTCPNCVPKETVTVSKPERDFSRFFMSTKEKLVTVLGNSYLEKLLSSGVLQNGYIVVSDKRVYFQGMQYSIGGDGELELRNNSKVVDLRDVTGTGFEAYANYRPLFAGVMWLLFGIIAFILAVIGFTNSHDESAVILGLVSSFAVILSFIFTITSFYKYFKSKHSVIIIQYAGGAIGYDLSWFNTQEVEMFQRQLHLAKDKIFES